MVEREQYVLYWAPCIIPCVFPYVYVQRSIETFHYYVERKHTIERKRALSLRKTQEVQYNTYSKRSTTGT